SLLCVLSFFLDGQAQVVLTHIQQFITKGKSATARIECGTKGISDFQSAVIHWYRHIPPNSPERILYIVSGQASYDDNSYGSKYSSWKSGTNICRFSVNKINSSDEGTYYCAYW
ncbi:LV321 protein, partial [Atlantisia rogersi]|nr:LV321 protein [Atlantisia rogersi]